MGGLLALASWALAWIAAVAVGLPWVVGLGRGSERRVMTTTHVRQAAWLGLSIVITIVAAANLLTPLRSPEVAVVILGLVAASGVGLVALRLGRRTRSRRRSRSAWLLSVVVALVISYFAFSAMGPVTNYDTGLYHLGAVRYAADFATIPGLANLYQAFGYNNVLVPFAASLMNGPWAGEGFRLANGLLITLLCMDLALRWAGRCRGRGTYVLLVGTAALLVPMVALVDYWVTSPTSDSAVFVLTIASLAYLVDSLQARTQAWRSAAVTLVLCALLVSMRPTMLVYAAVVVGVLMWRMARPASRPSTRGWGVLAFGVLVSSVLVVVQVLRDYLLSGWLMYPLSIVPFDVPWRAIDPVNNRLSTLGVARDPEAYETAITGFGWAGAWLGRVPRAWESYEWLALVLAVLVLLPAWFRVPTAARQARRLVLAMVPAAVSVAAWWVASPPSFRFAWGPLFGLAVVPLGWLMHDVAARGSRRVISPGRLVAVWSIAMLAVVGFSTVFRVDWSTMIEPRTFSLGPITVPYSVSPMPRPAVEAVPMTTGLVLVRPLPSDQCWTVYPLCTPLIETEVRLRGDVQGIPHTIQEGFAPN